MKLKVCGLNQYENICAIEALPEITHTGFIFVETSPRNAFNLATIPKKKAEVKRVGVFVNPSLETILHYFEAFDLDIIQLHGGESPSFCEQVQQKIAPVYKAMGIEDENSLRHLYKYKNIISAFVFDTKSVKRGGTGKKFNWDLLAQYKESIPFLLSGGIGPDDADILSSFEHSKCIGYDLNSRFENQPGVKNHEKLKKFISDIKQQKN